MTTVAASRRSMWVTARSRGVITGLGLMLLGAWGAIIPFVGPYFNFGYPPNSTWTWTATRGWLEVLPGAAAFVAGLALLFTASRVVGVLASWLAAAAGAWFVLGPLLGPEWSTARLGNAIGSPMDGNLAALGMFYGLGALIMLTAGTALGRFSVVGVRDVARVERLAASEEAAMAGTGAVGTAGATRSTAGTTAAPGEVVDEPAGAARGTTAAPDGTVPRQTTQSRHRWSHRRRETVG